MNRAEVASYESDMDTSARARIARNRSRSWLPVGGRLRDLYRRSRSFWAKGLSSTSARAQKQLKLCESLSIGERRLLLLVECRSQKFLLAAAGNLISLVSELRSEVDSSREELLTAKSDGGQP